MNSYPLVSIICTVYNKAPWLRKTIESFLDQESDFMVEILLIDDASTDDSASIIKEYSENYPENIRAFYNAENLGIAKTWVSICKEARGKYIARCDGDDFWLDPLKLKKQVEVLETSSDSKWCNTDFDIYDEKGQFVFSSGFENGTIPLADNFETMLATRGFTMASTWLVDRELMLEVNDELDLTTSDDTFNLQLDLFNKTKLTYVPEAMVAYVINQGSDSRPKDFNKILTRFNRLLKTQRDYVAKYPQSDYGKIINILLERNNQDELELVRYQYGLSGVGFEKITIYLADEEGNFKEGNTLQFSLEKAGIISFEVPEASSQIRIDLSENPSFYSQVSLVSKKTNAELKPAFTNATVVESSYFFPEQDPQLIYEISDIVGRGFVLNYQMYDVDDPKSDNYIAKAMTGHISAMNSKITELEHYKLAFEQQQQELEEMTNQYHRVISSRRWIIPTKIINFFRRNK